VNLCDCDSVLSERCRQTNSQDLLKNNNNVGLSFLKQVKTGTTYAESSFWQDSDSDPGLESTLQGLRLLLRTPARRVQC